ncbi:RsmE family RNA methyltransferase [Candidatus Omnitrophota bacterium]
MARLHCPEIPFGQDNIVINQSKQIHYLRDVLRLKVNDDVFVFDGQGNEYHCQILAMAPRKVTLQKRQKAATRVARRLSLAIACALPRQKSRFDDLVDKLSQLGVARIIPMVTERVVVRWDSRSKERHHQRWCEIAKQACMQSGRNNLPVIEPVKEMGEVLTDAVNCELKLIPTLAEKKKNLRDLFCDSLPGSALVLIGPEGDFSPRELRDARKAGFVPVFLGELVLRVDTAAIAVAAFFSLNPPAD